MNWFRIGSGLLLAAAGFVWAAQGLNATWAPGSFMTGSRAWVWLGGAGLIAGLGVAGRGARELLRSRREDR